MLKHSMNVILFYFLFFPIGVLISACNGGLDPITKPKAIDQYYLDNKWIPLPIGDSKFGPGAIIEAKPEKGIRWLSHLKTCGVDISLVKGNSPSLNFNNEDSFEAKAVLKIKGVEAGPSFNKVKSVKIAHEEHGGDAFDLFKLKIWLQDPQNAGKFSPVCEEELDRDFVFVVQEAYRVSKGKYTLLDNTNAAIKVENLALGPLKIEPGVEVKLGKNGELTFSDTVYTAIKNIKRVAGNFETLGKPAESEENQDDYIREVYFKNGFVGK